jgi:NADPH2:quinone reductase
MTEASVPSIVIQRHGGPEVLEWQELPLPRLKRNEVRVRHKAIGVNFADVYMRTGLYPVTLPAVLGSEAAGVVEEVGSAVGSVAVGDRVAYVLNGSGTYVTTRNVPADRLVKIPPGVSDEQAAAMMLKGLTVQYLLRRTYRVRRSDTIVFHAAAGGVGLIAVQWAKALGARVIGVVSTAEKANMARAHGADEIVLGSEPLGERVKALTGGKGVPVVYDSVGAATFQSSLDCLRPRGLMVSFGNASGPVPPVPLLELMRRGSLYVTRPTLAHYIATKGDLQRAARELFAVVSSGAVKIHIGQRYALKDAAQAHRDLEARRTTGSTVLLP